jgi:hypothetical protein
MDRLEKIKGYKDKASKDDVSWLIKVVEDGRKVIDALSRELEGAKRVAELASTELAKLKGEAPVEMCPCKTPDDHAGWCPRR